MNLGTADNPVMIKTDDDIREFEISSLSILKELKAMKETEEIDMSHDSEDVTHYNLFKFLSDEHGLTLTQEQMDEIKHEVVKSYNLKEEST